MPTKTKSPKNIRVTKYSIVNLMSQLGKRDKARVSKAIPKGPSLSSKEINKSIQRTNPKDSEGLQALQNGVWYLSINNDQKEIKKSLELISLNKSKEGQKTLYNSLGYVVLSPLIEKVSNFIIKASHKNALQEFERALISKSQTVVKRNGKTYVEQEAIKKCIKATPQELRNLEIVSQEAQNHNGKKLFPIEAILNTTLLA